MTNSSVERAPLSVIWLDGEQRITYVNEAACGELGYSHQELLFITIADADRDAADLWQPSRKALRESDCLTFESRHRNKSGEVLLVDIFVTCLEVFGTELSCTYSRNIADRKQTEAAIQERLRLKERLSRLAAIVPRAFQVFNMRLDGSACISYASPSLETMLGVPPDELVENAKAAFRVTQCDSADDSTTQSASPHARSRGSVSLQTEPWAAARSSIACLWE